MEKEIVVKPTNLCNIFQLHLRAAEALQGRGWLLSRLARLRLQAEEPPGLGERVPGQSLPRWTPGRGRGPGVIRLEPPQRAGDDVEGRVSVQ